MVISTMHCALTYSMRTTSKYGQLIIYWIRTRGTITRNKLEKILIEISKIFFFSFKSERFTDFSLDKIIPFEDYAGVFDRDLYMNDIIK